MTDIAVLAGFVVVWGLVSRRTDRWPLTGPMVFVAFGLIIGPDVADVVAFDADDASVLLAGEATLAVLLFVDAARIDCRQLVRNLALPARLLGIGLPLTVAATTVLVGLLAPDLGWAAAALVAAILAPTDAALGQAVVSDQNVPTTIRQSLNVESGLNDGLVVPAVTIFLVLTQAEASNESAGHWVRFAAEQIGYGVLVGAGFGLLGGFLLARARAANWVDGVYGQLTGLAIAIGAFATAGDIGGNGFIAAFSAGLAVRTVMGGEAETVTEFSEDLGQLLALVTFVLFGNVLVGPALDEVTFAILGCAVGTLTLSRMLPVAVALTGTGLKAPTVAFIGWFGPRGLASIVLGLVVLEEAGFAAGDEVFTIVTWTVLLSIVAHGATATWAARRYGEWYMATPGDTRGAMMESEETSVARARFAPRPDRGL